MCCFKQIDPKLDLVRVEEEIRLRWKKRDIFNKVNEVTKDLKNWVYYDGPITANGLPHYGHAITWTMKDVVPRYKTMQGNYVSRNMGWDCQGILVEYEVEKSLGFEEKGDIEKYGIDKFNQKCRESVLKFRSSMIDYETMLGRWINQDQYSTMDSNYIESMWWSFKELFSKGLLYEGYKVVAYSTRAGMTLSDHEVADGGYSEITDTAVTLKFPVKGQKETFMLAWTTTPWTLPGNLLLAVGEQITYIKVKYKNEYFIIAKDAYKRIFKEGESEVISEMPSSEIVGLEYDPLFSYYLDRKSNGAFKVIYADHVNTEDGTGIVHLAPYGMEDFEIFLKLKMPLFDYLNDEGKFKEEIKEYSGMFYKKASKYIIQDLQQKNLMFFSEDYAHQMPMCYRTHTPLIYRPIKSWYLNVEKIKPKLLSEAKKVNFPQEDMKKRFTNWIKNAHDWSLSRQRYWGTPMPIWRNVVDESDLIVIGSFKELSELSKTQLNENFDPHKPFVDNIEIKTGKGTYRRILDVIDVWYDSGSMPFAQYHYPFENIDEFKKGFPAEYISEGTDQLRLWFYTMFLLNVALFDTSPFKNVLVTGMLGDEKGKKMSKSKGNYPPIEEVFSKYGADMLRYFLLKSGVAGGEPSRFSYPLLEETRKEFFTMLWNSYRYFVTYAGEFKPGQVLNKNKLDVIDSWILIRLNQTISQVTSDFEKYEVQSATRNLAPFVEDLSTWYIRRSRDRISENEPLAVQVLYQCLNSFSILLAPFLPMLSEEIYLGVNKELLKESVHLESYPKAAEVTEDDLKLIEDMKYVRNICSLGNSLRKENNLPVRQPLKSITVINKPVKEELLAVIKDELNVKEVYFDTNVPSGENLVNIEQNGITAYMDTALSKELILEGDFRALVRYVQGQRKELGLNVVDKIDLVLEDTKTNKNILAMYEKELSSKVGSKNITLGDKNSVLLVKH